MKNAFRGHWVRSSGKQIYRKWIKFALGTQWNLQTVWKCNAKKYESPSLASYSRERKGCEDPFKRSIANGGNARVVAQRTRPGVLATRRTSRIRNEWRRENDRARTRRPAFNVIGKNDLVAAPGVRRLRHRRKRRHISARSVTRARSIRHPPWTTVNDFGFPIQFNDTLMCFFCFFLYSRSLEIKTCFHALHPY